MNSYPVWENQSTPQYSLYQDLAYKRKSRLKEIDEILDAFVPAMRTTQISQELIVKLINIHRNKSSEGSVLEYLAMTKSNNNTQKATEKLGKEELLCHFDGLEKSFAKFASNNPKFKDLSGVDQSSLLKRNSTLFVMVSRRKKRMRIEHVILVLSFPKRHHSINVI